MGPAEASDAHRLLLAGLFLTTALLAAAPPAQAAGETEQEPGFPVPAVRCFQAVGTPVGGGACAVMVNPQPDPPGLPFFGVCGVGVLVMGHGASCVLRIGPWPPDPCRIL